MDEYKILCSLYSVCEHVTKVSEHRGRFVMRPYRCKFSVLASNLTFTSGSDEGFI